MTCQSSPEYVLRLTVTFCKKEVGRPDSPFFRPAYDDLIEDQPYDCPARRLEDGDECNMTVEIDLTPRQCDLLEKCHAVRKDWKVDLDILIKNNKKNLFDFILKYNSGEYYESHSRLVEAVVYEKFLGFKNLH